MRRMLLATLLACATHVQAERFITMNLTVNGIPRGSYTIGTAPPGSSDVVPLFSATFDGTEESDPLTDFRNQMMPPEGIPGVGKRAFRVGPHPLGFQVFHPDSTQFWASEDDGATWEVIEKGNGTSFQADGPSGQFTRISFHDDGTNEALTPVAQGPTGACDADIEPRGGDGIVDLDDILSVLEAFAGRPRCSKDCIGAGE